jgi:hypothetical protein
MLNQQKQGNNNENDTNHIMRGGENITDNDVEEIDSQMARQLQQLN